MQNYTIISKCSIALSIICMCELALQRQNIFSLLTAAVNTLHIKHCFIHYITDTLETDYTYRQAAYKPLRINSTALPFIFMWLHLDKLKEKNKHDDTTFKMKDDKTVYFARQLLFLNAQLYAFNWICNYLSTSLKSPCYHDSWNFSFLLIFFCQKMLFQMPIYFCSFHNLRNIWNDSHFFTCISVLVGGS